MVCHRKVAFFFHQNHKLLVKWLQKFIRITSVHIRQSPRKLRKLTSNIVRTFVTNALKECFLSRTVRCAASGPPAEIGRIAFGQELDLFHFTSNVAIEDSSSPSENKAGIGNHMLDDVMIRLERGCVAQELENQPSTFHRNDLD